MTQQYFEPPTEARPVGADRLWSHFRYFEGVSVLKFGAQYISYNGLVQDELIQTADITYLGGHIYAISDAEATALTTAGYGDFVVTDPAGVPAGTGTPPINPGGGGSGGGSGGGGSVDPGEYGEGAFGAGEFGE